MKKILTLLLTMCMVLALAGCGSQSKDNQESVASPQSENAERAEEGNEAESIETNALSSEDETLGVDSGADMSSTENNDQPEETSGGSTLVAYFSCTGNTKGVAEKIASALNADLYEIVPEDPYSEADLNYSDSSSRGTVEQNDDTCRPAILGSVENMEDYDTIFLGYPIWWGQAPKIMYTFAESYDFSGKTIVPFCTSGSSGVGSSASNLESSAASANWLSGTRFSSGVSDEDIQSWLSGLELG